MSEIKKTVDLIMFMGQSNMAGRGITCERWQEPAPKMTENAGFEFRAVTDPTRVYPIEEPFGVNENVVGGINDVTPENVNMKTGSMVTAFVNAYYEKNGKIPVAAVSASKGGSAIAEWQPGAPTAYVEDAARRMKAAEDYLSANAYEIRGRYILWCQGETDGDNGTSKEEYFRMFRCMLDTMKSSGIEKLFLVQIGKCNIEGSMDRYDAMIRWQEELSECYEDVVLVSTDLATMRERGLMKDEYHYYQAAYNETGTNAGIRAAMAVGEK